jgi:hypothetical protein
MAVDVASNLVPSTTAETNTSVPEKPANTSPFQEPKNTISKKSVATPALK